MGKSLLVAILMTGSMIALAESPREKSAKQEIELARQVDEASLRCNVTAPEFKPSEVGSMIYFIATCEDPRSGGRTSMKQD